MKDPHNYRAVGWSMVEPFFSDTIMKNKEKEFEERKKLEMESELGGTEFNASVNSLVFKNIL